MKCDKKGFWIFLPFFPATKKNHLNKTIYIFNALPTSCAKVSNTHIKIR